jgi:hypothetical protein
VTLAKIDRFTVSKTRGKTEFKSCEDCAVGKAWVDELMPEFSITAALPPGNG